MRWLTVEGLSRSLFPYGGASEFVVASLCVEALTGVEKNVGRFSDLMFPFIGSVLLSGAAQRVMQYSLKACLAHVGMEER